jgi:hypothetical protein
MRESKSFMDIDEFRATIERFAGFEWIDDEKSWFWLGSWVGGNKILDRAMDVLLVARRPLDIENIYNGITRMSRTHESEIGGLAGIMPPMEIVLQLLRKCPAFACQQGDDFRLVDDTAEWETFSDSAREIIDYLRDHAGMASRAELRRALIEERGMSAITMSVTLSIHPTIQQIDRGVWGIRGWPISASRLRDLREESLRTSNANSRQVSVLDGGKRIDWEFVLSASAIGNSQVWVPSGAVQYLSAGNYRCGTDTLILILDQSPRINGGMRMVRALGAVEGNVIKVSMSTGDCTIAFAIVPDEDE